MIRPKSISALLAAVRVARINPHARFDVPGGFPITSADVLALWRRGVDARASRGLPQHNEARFCNLSHDARVINERIGQRVRRSGANILRDPRMARRYPHIHNCRFED